MKIIDNFNGQYRFLSNFYDAPVEYEGVKYLNNEAAFQAQKNLKRKMEFVNLPPNKAKALGRKVELRSDWDDVKVQIMKDLVYLKFTQNPELKKLLLATGDAELIEGNWWNDTFWGVCKGEGSNVLGNILEEVRRNLTF